MPSRAPDSVKLERERTREEERKREEKGRERDRDEVNSKFIDIKLGKKMLIFLILSCAL